MYPNKAVLLLTEWVSVQNKWSVESREMQGPPELGYGGGLVIGGVVVLGWKCKATP